MEIDAQKRGRLLHWTVELDTVIRNLDLVAKLGAVRSTAKTKPEDLVAHFQECFLGGTFTHRELWDLQIAAVDAAIVAWGRLRHNTGKEGSTVSANFRVADEYLEQLNAGVVASDVVSLDELEALNRQLYTLRGEVVAHTSGSAQPLEPIPATGELGVPHRSGPLADLDLALWRRVAAAERSVVQALLGLTDRGSFGLD